MNYRFIFRALAIVIVAGVFLTSCFKTNDSVYLDELDITLTYYDTEFDFGPYNTFTVRDSVGLITNYLTKEQKEEFFEPGGTSDKIRNYVAQKFKDLGYTEVTQDDNYDFGVNLVATFVNTTTIVSSPGWWGYYPDYWYWYGGWWDPWYGYYPWGYQVYQHQTGTVLIEMADGASVREYQEFIEGKTEEELEDIPPEDFPTVYFRWQATITGILGSTAEYNEDRAVRGINEAFENSSYLSN